MSRLARSIPALGAALACVAVTLAAASPAAAQLTELGGDFRISTTGVDGDFTLSATDPAVVHNPTSGEYLAVWGASALVNGADSEIFGQRISAAGEELGVDFRISTTGPDGDPAFNADAVALAHNSAANEYLAVWEADGPTNDENEIFGQRLSGAGVELGTDFRISTTGADGDADRDATSPSVAYNPSANEYVVVWQADALTAEGEVEIFGQRLAGAGAELGGDFRISTTRADGDAERDALDPTIVHNPTANEYLVAWQADALAVDEEDEVFGQRLSAAAAELGGDFRISTTGADGDVTRAADDVALASNPAANEYLAVWHTLGFVTADEDEIFGQRISGGRRRGRLRLPDLQHGRRRGYRPRRARPGRRPRPGRERVPRGLGRRRARHRQ